jgi:hypothetical protein
LIFSTAILQKRCNENHFPLVLLMGPEQTMHWQLHLQAITSIQKSLPSVLESQTQGGKPKQSARNSFVLKKNPDYLVT